MDTISIPWFRLLLGICFIAAGFAIYMLPSILSRNKKHFVLILITNILAGWTGIVWLGLLVNYFFRDKIIQTPEVDNKIET
jgi:hypothetical protein